MDAHGQIGPEKGDYDTDVLGVAQALTSGATVFVTLADRMTSYPLVLAGARSVTFLREKDAEAHAGQIFVAHEGKGAAWFQIDGYAHPSYVNEKLAFTSGGDGEVVAEFVNRLTRALTLTVTS